MRGLDPPIHAFSSPKPDDGDLGSSVLKSSCPNASPRVSTHPRLTKARSRQCVRRLGALLVLDTLDRVPHSKKGLDLAGLFAVGLRSKVSFAVGAACLFAAMPREALAAGATSITIDGRFSPAQTLVPTNGVYAIGANLGKQVGGNLFQSFGNVRLSTGQTAAFSGPKTVSNVIGGVTGGSASSIDGKIQSTIAGANLYLINPSGIVFGPHATVNVLGSFHASTADYLKLSDGKRFQVSNANGTPERGGTGGVRFSDGEPGEDHRQRQHARAGAGDSRAGRRTGRDHRRQPLRAGRDDPCSERRRSRRGAGRPAQHRRLDGDQLRSGQYRPRLDARRQQSQRSRRRRQRVHPLRGVDDRFRARSTPTITVRAPAGKFYCAARARSH